MNKIPAIIPVSSPDCQVNSWKYLLKTAISDPWQLLSLLNLHPDALPYNIDPSNQFTLRVPRPYIDKMQPGNPEDPLLLQVISQQAENIQVAGYSQDPLSEVNNTCPGILHKYHGRLLMILSSACAINCRYCFRRHFPYQEQQASGTRLNQSLNYIRNHSTIKEVILSGGDPLIISDEKLEKIIEQLEAIPHVIRLRFHTRLPVVIPQRVTTKLCQRLKNSRLQVSMVLHINHPNEIDTSLHNAVARLADSGIQLLNQSVLLKGINDNAETLILLSETLFASRIMPYYIHMLDKVAGAAHFDTDKEEAIKLLKEVRNHLPGYLCPALAVEKPDEPAKRLIS